MLTLAACGGSSQSGVVDGFLGGAVAEEPRAAVVGRDVLAAGGSAADAAVAMYFTLAVTLPTAASLGGGGACLIQDPSTGGLTALEFLPSQPLRLAGTSDVIPGNARGMFALHARFGFLDWQDLVAPAENFARAGHPLSRATAGALATLLPAIAADRQLAATFTGPGGAILAEANTLRQIELGAVLTALRTRGPGALYGGPVGRQFIDGLPDGAGLRLDDLRGYRTRFRDPLRYDSGDRAIAFLPPPVIGGTLAGQVWGVLTGGAYDNAGPGRAAAQVVAARAAAAALPQWMRRDGTSDLPLADLIDPGRLGAFGRGTAATAGPANAATSAADMAAAGTGFVAADLAGQMVACAVTMNRPLGLATTARGTGIVLAAPPDPALPAPISAMIMINPNIQLGFFAAAAAGPADLLPPVAYGILRDDADPLAALSAPRALYDPALDAAVVEADMPAPARQGLADAGLAPRAAAAPLGRVAVIWCPIGLPRSLRCTFANDPRGPGLAASAD